jgi:excinuclease ABC subunit A
VYLGVFDVIRQLFADSADGRAAGISAGFFSFNSGEGRCERCWGTGSERIEMQFLSDLFVTCPECLGRRYQAHALKIRLEGRNIHEVLGLTLEQAAEFFSAPVFAGQRKLAQAVAAMQIMVEAGLGYLTLGQPLNTLSGGEAQRLKLVGHLLELQGGGADEGDSLLLLDEPTTGLHFDDIAMLVKLLQRLVDGGCSLVVIEHNLEVIACADWVVDLGPEGGSQGGQLVVCGTPEQVEQCEASHTGLHLRLQRQAVNGLVQDRPAGRRAAPELSPVISICGAREHNLKNISLDIPRQQMVVVTGLSGSGKSSLAFDLVFAEGQRRFLDSMSVYARSFVEQMERPQVDRITGVPPTVAIEQRVSRGGGKSTVATVTEIWHFMRLLFSKLGVQHCPQCQVPVESQSVTAITAALEKAARRGAIELLAPLVKGRKGFHTEVAEAAARQGIEQLWVDGKWMATEGFKPLARFKEHQIDALVARVPRATSALLLRPLVEKALKMGRGSLKWRQGVVERVQSTQMSCPQCENSFEPLDPRLFSFNSPHGWCRHCRGFGIEVGAAPGGKPDASALEVELEEERRVARRNEEDDEGEGGGQRRVCIHCGGSRLNEVARAVHLPLARAGGSVRIEEVHGMAAGDAAQWLGRLRFTGREAQIARDILLEIRQRLKFMQEVGLGYLQLSRSADTLSGGEAQRIRLSAQLGSNLRGVLYVLDEPTIGLHPRDNQRLLSTLQSLRDKGNSLLVVEHDEDTMRCADQIIDLGPGAGRLGGEVLAQGNLRQLLTDERSVTGRSLAKPLVHPMLGRRRKLPAKAARQGWLRVKGACANNLKDLEVNLPVGRLCVITGVSGSGKSTLMHQVLLPAARQSGKRGKTKASAAQPWREVIGFDQVAAVHEVNQAPIGKTSRSCPATYVGVLDDIRRLYAQLPSARARGFDAGRFSFNNDAGRCEACQGNGEIKVEMNFLPTTRMPCESCAGLRFNAATLEVEYQGRSIGEVLAMSIGEAAEFFAAQPRIAGPLKLLAEMGVGYLQLGQPSPTLSGGEAQRLKLVTELSSGQSRHVAARLRGLGSVKGNLYLIEEPTIGLHLDDVKRLLEVLHRLVDEGHTVVVIEHHPALFAEADYLLDLGPEAGAQGGRLMASGTPEQVAASRRSVTAPFLREALAVGKKAAGGRQKAH